jgi:L-threonylcarbamoyladenylate synthase
MRIIKIDPKKPEPKILEEAAAAVRKGGLIVYPTETVYGLGADASSDDAVKKIYAVKTRDPKNPISVAVSSREMLRNFAELSPAAETLAKKLLPGPLTLVLLAKPGISPLLVTKDKKIGVRVPDHPVVLKLVETIGKPITSTSANLSGRPSPTTVEEALAQLGDRVDIALDAGKCRIGVPSTVLDMTSDPPRVIREGAIQKHEISKILGVKIRG